MLLGFKKRFVEPIQIGTKVFTMRNKRKTDPIIGETLYMYTGLRTSNCSLISNKEKLVSIQKVEVALRVHVSEKRKITYADDFEIKVDGRFLELAELPQFVGFDGFESTDDFVSYWMQGLKVKKHFEFTPGHYWNHNELDLFHWTDLRY